MDIKNKLARLVPSKKKMILTGIIFAIVFVASFKILKWHDTHQIHGQSPIVVKLQTPIYATLRQLIVNNTYTVQADEKNTPLNANQQYACDKFGDDCKLALAIAHAENGTGVCDRINWSNANQSLDIGFFQINTLWVDKKLVPPADLFDCRKNIDFAYQLYKRSGNSFKLWSTFQNGAYKKFLW